MSEEKAPKKRKKAVKVVSYSKCHSNPFFIKNVEITSGFKPSAKQLKDADFMGRLARAIQVGRLKED